MPAETHSHREPATVDDILDLLSTVTSVDGVVDLDDLVSARTAAELAARTVEKLRAVGDVEAMS